MSMFISKALRRAEVFLEQVDDRVAQASRRLAVEGATGYVEDDDYASDDEAAEGPSRRRAAEIARARDPNSNPTLDPPQEPVATESSVKSSEDTEVLKMELSADRGSAKDELFSDTVPAKKEPVIDPTNPPGKQELEIGTVASSTNSDAVTTSASVQNSETESSRPPPVSGSQRQNAITPKESARISSQAKETQENQKIANTIRPSASVETSAADDTQAQSAAAKFLMGINKARETAGSLLGEAVLDDNQYIAELQTENTELRKELEQIEEDFEDLRKDRSKMVKNLKRMKEIVSEMDESLQEKGAEARRLEAELLEAKDEARKLQEDMKASNASDKEALESLRAKLTAELQTVRKEEVALRAERSSLVAENQSLREALKSGQDLELAISTGARKEAMEAHHAYETEVAAHRETKRLVKEREESLEAQTALAAKALAAAERKADECLATANGAKTAQRAAESKLNSAITNREIAFARIEDLEQSLRRYEGEDGAGPPGKEELESMQVTISELENALETKNVELKRLEGEVEAVKDAMAARRDLKSPRSPNMRALHTATHSVEVEQKLRHMADASLRKQAQLEVLRSENRALQHQLDTERKRTREAQAMAAVASSSRQSIRGGFRGILEAGEEERGARAFGIRDGPLSRFRAPRNWPRALVRGITAVDRFSAQALAFLRKEPLLRIVLLVYLILAHLYIWVLLRYHAEAITRSAEDGMTKGGGAVH